VISFIGNDPLRQFTGWTICMQDALKQLWRLAYPKSEIPPLKSELWKEMGWQGTDPSTDFRYVDC